MSQRLPDPEDNVVPLPAASRSLRAHEAAAAAGRVRRQLSLLQGYADLMDGLSPEQHVQVMRVMAEKVSELTQALHPFVEPSRTKQGRRLNDYREARTRTRHLLDDYRLLLHRLRDTVADARQASVASPPR
jgi:hypothetical protein